MTKNESKILEYLKPLADADRTKVLAKFNDEEFEDKASGKSILIRHEDRLDCLIAFGCIEADGSLLHITPKGLHELDEYPENQTRLKRAEFLSILALRISAVSAFAAVAALFKP